MVVVVLANGRSGSSCTAVALHRIGVNMGSNVTPEPFMKGAGAGEDRELTDLLDWAMPLPAIDPVVSRTSLIARLKQYLKREVPRLAGE